MSQKILPRYLTEAVDAMWEGGLSSNAIHDVFKIGGEKVSERQIRRRIAFLHREFPDSVERHNEGRLNLIEGTAGRTHSQKEYGKFYRNREYGRGMNRLKDKNILLRKDVEEYWKSRKHEKSEGS
jgi:hypothetical protein